MKKYILLAAVAALGLSLTPGGVAGAAAPPPTITWAPCPEDTTAECGALKVPVDWDTPGGATIDLAVARREAAGPAARVGSLVVNPGGPGASGVDFVVHGSGYFSAELRGRFDIVGFDPRGVGRSHPVVCSAALVRERPHPLIENQSDMDAWVSFNQRLQKDCRARTGPLYDHVSSLDVARDVNALRAALGEDKLTYYGVSHGTLIGQAYAERFPGKVRALVLDSNFDHSVDTAAYLNTTAAHAAGAFDQFVIWCEATASCALHGTDIRAFWKRLLDRADRGELHEPGLPDVPMGAYELVNTAFAGLYNPNWAELAHLLQAIDTGGPGPAASAQKDEEVPVSTPVFCQDFHLPVADHAQYASLLRRQAPRARDMRYSPPALGRIAGCLGQPTPIPNPQHRLRVDATPPILLASSLNDPATGYLWTLSTAEQIGAEARVLTYEGSGHGVYGRSACTTGAIDRYLISQSIPAHGVRCPEVRPAPLAPKSELANGA
ncbi:alpha/beta hydrolase [Nonomuraea sp. FMUSA5-5]|uniref:Alpha/beta hydrolase n=1 Tax=Nonomuraea composti TaxID=2720023 RepID=A0ABX1B8F9_9ACTN|nr:alpha/beta hydrolase [Nonomuraea sp. FMUSA5-5]NJP92825.1 alpha/beta hydrolase [Nonomuraea sp. FMUSA5-5]